jgi:hypothetical protein
VREKSSGVWIRVVEKFSDSTLEIVRAILQPGFDQFIQGRADKAQQQIEEDHPYGDF